MSLTILTEIGIWCAQVRPSQIAQLDSFQLDFPRILFAGLLGSLAPWLCARFSTKAIAILIGVLSMGVLGGIAEGLGRLAMGMDREFIVIDALLSTVLWAATGLAVVVILSIGSRAEKGRPGFDADA